MLECFDFLLVELVVVLVFVLFVLFAGGVEFVGYEEFV
jgi:hypothetical protein